MPRVMLTLFACVPVAGAIWVGNVTRDMPGARVGRPGGEDIHGMSKEESHLYRLYVCEECRSYIKAIDLRCTESEVLLPLERMMAEGMDRQG